MFAPFHSLYPSQIESLGYPTSTTAFSPPSIQHQHQHHHQHQQSQDVGHQAQARRHQQAPARTVLSILRADEALIEGRKAIIRQFGSAWLKPPGVPKTLQGMEDERVEREEQEAAAMREQAALEAQQLAEEAREMEARAVAAVRGDGGDSNPASDAERDLDDDIPDADADGDVDVGDYEGEDAWSDEDGVMPGEEGDGDYAAGEDSALAGAEDGMGRDLDDDVLEAGSYEHTDTELEDDESSTVGADLRSSLPGTGLAQGPLGGSVFGASPAMMGGNTARTRTTGGRRSSGRIVSGRVAGREN